MDKIVKKDSYKEKNFGYITASRLKTFLKSPEAYYLEYVKETDIPRKETKSFLIGTAFDDYLSYGPIKFFEKYFCDKGETKGALAIALSGKGVYVSGKESLDELRSMMYPDWEKKVRLTAGETDTVFGMLAEAQRQPMFDVSGEYTPQFEVIAKFKDKLMLKGTLDRVSLEKQLIRDYKTTQAVGSFSYDLHSKYGYDISMAFYYALVLIAHDIKCDVLLDVVQTTAPFPSDVFGYRKEKLDLILKSVILPGLTALLAKQELWEQTGDEDVWKVNVDIVERYELFHLDSYPYLESSLIKQVNYI